MELMLNNREIIILKIVNIFYLLVRPGFDFVVDFSEDDDKMKNIYVRLTITYFSNKAKNLQNE